MIRHALNTTFFPKVNKLKPMLDYFPLATPRSKQVGALERADQYFRRGIQDVVIAAPTGIGKTGIGAAICFWAEQPTCADEDFLSGGYYLVTQKLLQDQIEHDFPRFKRFSGRCASLKSAIEYRCPQYATCMAGRSRPEGSGCTLVGRGCCRYLTARSAFTKSLLSVTNYAYFFNERSYLGQFSKRRVLICDECHTLERQLMSFIEFIVNKEALEKWAPQLDVPHMPHLEQFVDWLRTVYAKTIEERLKMLHERLMDDYQDHRVQDEWNKLTNHINRMKTAIADMAIHPQNWIYWQQINGGLRESVAKPLFVSDFVAPLLREPAGLRVFMSAYPGPKKVFCRSLGLDPNKVAWFNLNSPFSPKNRPVHVLSIGSMGRKSIDDTLPRVLRVTESILRTHRKEKGIIHCHSYSLGHALDDYLRRSAQGPRVLFARQAKDRIQLLRTHASSPEPTVLLSPSIAEGFSFDDELARFQVVAKMPYPYLGDQQIAARKDLDPEWYIMQTVMTVIQACGRIVRSDTDYGTTYILDSDFERIYQEHTDFFPQWFQEALIWRT